MTSAEFSKGYDGKPTSRVLRPPGGGSSNIFGTAEPEPIKVTDRKSDTKENIYGSGDVNTAKQEVVTEQKQNNTEAEENIQSKKSEEEENGEHEAENTEDTKNVDKKPEEKKEEQISTAKPNRGGFNPITGEAYGETKKPVHTSTKVRQPPGGASSGLW